MGNKKGHNKRAKVGDFAMTLIMKFFLFSRDTFMQFPFLPVMLGIDAIVA